MAEGVSRKCNHCAAELKPGRVSCRTCGAWNFDPPKAHHVKRSFEIEADGTVVMSKVTSVELDRVVTGPWDDALGGGLVRGNTVLLGGAPGAGKSTIILQIMSEFLKVVPNGDALYIASEEVLSAIRSRADRLGVPAAIQDRMRLADAMSGGVDVGRVLLKRKPVMIAVDSVNGMVGDDLHASVELCKIVKKYAATLNAATIVTSHYTKDGDFAGLMGLQHEVDTLITLEVEEGGLRTLEARKNRTGRTFVPVYFTMGESGLELAALPEDDENDAGQVDHS